MKNKKDIIFSISEAFSMQPTPIRVGEFLNGNKFPIHKIEKEHVVFYECGDAMQYDYYVGRDAEGNKMFEFKAESVNVIYKN